MVGALGTGRLMGLLGARGMPGLLWVGGVMGVTGTGGVTGWPLPRCKALGPWALGRGADVGPIPALIP